MPTVVLDQDVYERLETLAKERLTTADTLVGDAARQYLWELERQKISEESAIYRKRHAEIKEKFLGEYIAMHEGEVVDHDEDMERLWRRIRQRFGRTPIMITYVDETPDITLTRLGFRFEP